MRKKEAELRRAGQGRRTRRGSRAAASDLAAEPAPDAAQPDPALVLAPLFRIAPGVSLLVDRDGRILDVTDHLCGLLQRDKERVVGRLAVDLVDEDQRSAFEAIRTAPLAGDGRSETVEIRFMRTDGSVIETDATVIGSEGLGDRRLIVAVDLTPRNSAERALRAKAEELQVANEKLMHFAYMASHDLQEPLRKIGAFTDLLESALERGDQSDVTYAMGVVRRSALRARQLVHDLLAYSRSSRRELELDDVDLRAVVDDVLSSLTGRISESSAILVVQTEPAIVRADRTQLFQLIMNLVSNSLKFHRPGVEPYVTVTSFRDRDGVLGLRIADQGIGFEQGQADLIFEPFKRLSSAPGHDGSGIGLAICRTIADRHGWQVLAQGRPGEGATFQILFTPAAPETAA